MATVRFSPTHTATPFIKSRLHCSRSSSHSSRLGGSLSVSDPSALERRRRDSTRTLSDRNRCCTPGMAGPVSWLRAKPNVSRRHGRGACSTAVPMASMPCVER